MYRITLFNFVKYYSLIFDVIMDIKSYTITVFGLVSFIKKKILYGSYAKKYCAVRLTKL